MAKRYVDRMNEDFEQELANFGKNKLDKRSAQSVQTDRWDDRNFKNYALHVTKFVNAKVLLQAATPNGAAEAKDLWHMLVQGVTNFVPEELMRDDARLLLTINQALEQHDLFDSLHFRTMGDKFEAARAVAIIAPTVIEMLKQQKDLQEQLQEQQERYNEEQKVRQQAAKTMVSEAQAEKEGDQAKVAELQALIAELLTKAGNLHQEREDQEGTVVTGLLVEKSAIEDALDKAVKEAIEKNEQEMELYDSWGVPRDDVKHMDPNERIRLATLLDTPRMKEVMGFIGAMKHFSPALSRKLPGIPQEYVGADTGDDLSRVVPSHLAYLRNPKTKTIFFKDFVDQRLPLFAVEGENSAGRGGIVMVTDVSSSMVHGMNWGITAGEIGSRINFAIALTIITAGIAKRENRPFKVIFFNHAIRQVYELLKPEDFTPEILYTIASMNAAGETEFQKPLYQALEFLEKEAKTKGRAQSDILFVTDGDSSLGEGFIENMLKRLKVVKGQIRTVIIGLEANKQMHAITEGRIATISQLTEKGVANVRNVFKDISEFRTEEEIA